MATITVSFPDGTRAEFPAGTAAGKALQGHLDGVRGALVAARVGGRLVDLTASLTADCRVEGVGFDSPEGREVFRHSSAHIMAEAVADLFPGAKFAIGPAIEDGFYYDFDVEKPFTPEDLARIEKRMAEIVKANTPFVRSGLPRQEALRAFPERAGGDRPRPGQPVRFERAVRGGELLPGGLPLARQRRRQPDRHAGPGPVRVPGPRPRARRVRRGLRLRWDGEEPVMLDVMKQFGRADALLLLHRAAEGVSAGRGGRPVTPG